MDTDELIGKMRSGKWTRREMNKALASVGLAMVSIPLVRRPAKAAAEDHPLFFAWEGYEVPEMHPDYVAKYGEAPNVSLFGDEEEAFAKMRAGFKPDVTMPCSYKIRLWYDAGMLAPIDESRLSNWPDTIDSLKTVPDSVIDGKRYWVCLDWGQTSITYREDLVDFDEESWGLLWDERYAGRMSMFDSLIDGVMVAAIYGGAKNPFNMTDAEVEMTKDLLKKQLPLLRYYSNSLTDIEQALASGELVAAVTWNDSYTRLVEDGLPVKFMNPKEGAMTWTCGLSLMSGSDKIDRAYELIDSMLSPEAGVYEIMEHGFGHANRKAFQLIGLVDEQHLTKRGLPTNAEDLDKFFTSGIFQEPIANEPVLEAMFEEIKAGL